MDFEEPVERRYFAVVGTDPHNGVTWPVDQFPDMRGAWACAMRASDVGRFEMTVYDQDGKQRATVRQVGDSRQAAARTRT